MTNTRRQVVALKAANSAALVLEERDALAQKALELRRSGMSFFKVAEKMGLSEQEVGRLVGDAINSAAALVSQATRHQILMMELDRLDALQHSVWDDAMAGDTRAIDSVLKVMDMRAKRLGLDLISDTSSAQTVIVTGNTEEYRAALQAIVEGRAG